MKKYSPYLLPLIVLSVVFFLVFRWYNERSERLQNDLFGEGIQIENLSEEELQDTLGGTANLRTVELEPAAPEVDEDGEGDTAQEAAFADGVIRYESLEDRVRFSVIATLPMTGESYQVFLREVDTDNVRFAFTLTPRKGGFIGTASIPQSNLPVEVLVTRGGTSQPGAVLLRGTLEADQVEEVEAVDELTEEVED